MAPYLKPPAIEAPWPPKGFASRVEVTDADDWWILAATHGRTDPWDIIVFNFDTRDPNEVNWYLHNVVGCNRVSDKGKNYGFGGKGSAKQFIYIPPADWTPPTSADEEATFLVHSVITSKIVQGMHISISPLAMSISSANFRTVGALIAQKRIRVRLDTGHPQGAEYVSAKDEIIISGMGKQILDRSTIVHEAVHANFDKRRSEGVYTQVVTEECFAYVVQMRYLQYFYGATMPIFGSFEAKPIWDAAWPIANSSRTGETVSYSDAENLKSVLMRTGPYRGLDPNQGTDHNGVR